MTKLCCLSGFWLLTSGIPVRAETPVSSLPGVVDAGSFTNHRSQNGEPAPGMKPVSIPIAMMDNPVDGLVQALNKIPEEQLSEKSGPAVSLLEQLQTIDAPNYAKLRTLVARADVRKTLNPGVKCLVAGLLSPRWDGFNISGNLYLAALKSKNSDFRIRARQKLVGFIQPAHIPALINTLNTPGPNVLAYEVLQEVTGQSLEPNPKLWMGWWAKNQAQADLVGHVLDKSRLQLAQAQLHPFDQNKFWYIPDGVANANGSFDSRPVTEQGVVSNWNDWAKTDVQRYLEDWDKYKPLFERVVHQPDPRVAEFLQTLTTDPGFGDYASVVLAWRKQADADKWIQQAYLQWPTVGRALAMGALGNKESLQHLFQMASLHKEPLTYGIMDNTVRGYAMKLPSLGVVSTEQAFELLTRQKFELASAGTRGEKKKALKKAKAWLKRHYASLTFDPERGYFVTPQETKD